MPSQQQVRWSQLRVGITVIVSTLILAVLIFLMTGEVGLFTSKIRVRAYFENAEGLRVGAPVRLEGVDIGNVTAMRVVNRPLTPVEVTMKISTRYKSELHKDSQAVLTTAGVLGETFVDISSKSAHGPPAVNNDELPTQTRPDIQDMVRASQGTLQNIDVLIKRLDRIVSTIESGQGSVGKLINDPDLYNRLNETLGEMQKIANQISGGKGSIGKLINNDELYDKLKASIDKVDRMVDQIDKGQGTIGKLIKDPSLYNEAHSTIAKANQLMADINAGKGALGKFTHDEEFAHKLDDTISKLNSLLARMDAGEGSVGKLFRDPSLYANADQMLLETRKLVQAIREDPKKYLTIRFRVF
ncbi:MAG: MlaD family protein [Acidobacteriia bacterium]|nr:MlaD family protein [Terriglobia bacterium]